MERTDDVEINLELAANDLIELLAYLDFIELRGTKPVMLMCPACGRKNRKYAKEQHNDGCLIKAAQSEFERRLAPQRQAAEARKRETDSK